MNPNDVGKFILNLRKENNLTQSAFAKMFGVTFQAVSKWENGKCIPDILILQEICDKFHLDINEIFGKEKRKKKKRMLLFVIGIILAVLVITILALMIIKPFNKADDNKNDFEFKTLSSGCSDFNISGSVAYNETRSNIYISEIEYCGGNDITKYKQIEAVLYETHGDLEKRLGFHSTKEDEVNITLEAFLQNLKFNVINYCNEFDDTNLFIQISATNNNNQITTYKVALNNPNMCHTL